MRIKPLRIVAAFCLAGLLLASTSCSKDDNKSSDATTTVAAGAGTGDFCKVNTETASAPALDRVEKLLAVAPAEVKPDLEKLKEAVTVQNDPKADSIQKAEAAQNVQEPFASVAAYIAANCPAG